MEKISMKDKSRAPPKLWVTGPQKKSGKWPPPTNTAELFYAPAPGLQGWKIRLEHPFGSKSGGPFCLPDSRFLRGRRFPLDCISFLTATNFLCECCIFNVLFFLVRALFGRWQWIGCDRTPFGTHFLRALLIQKPSPYLLEEKILTHYYIRKKHAMIRTFTRTSFFVLAMGQHHPVFWKKSPRSLLFGGGLFPQSLLPKVISGLSVVRFGIK